MKKLALIITLFVSITSQAQTSEEIEMVTMVNQVRTNPKSFIPTVEAYITKLEAKKANPMGDIKISGNVKVVSTANKSGLTDALIAEAKKLVVFLRSQKPVKALELSVYLYPVTKSQAKYLDSTHQVSHTGPNGHTLAERTKNIGLSISENVTNTKGTVSDVLIQLLMDYGVTDKGHRANLFNAKATQISVAKVGQVWVQNFAY